MIPRHISTSPDYPNGNGNPPVYHPHGMCRCVDARHDDWECPTCRRPSFSAARVVRLQRMVGIHVSEEAS